MTFCTRKGSTLPYGIEWHILEMPGNGVLAVPQWALDQCPITEKSCQDTYIS